MPRTNCPPKLRHHKASGRAVVTINGRDLYLGTYGSPEARREYRRILAEHLASDGQPTASNATVDLTVTELVDRFRVHAERYYMLPSGKHSTEFACIRCAVKPLLKLYGHVPAKSFGPVALETIRAQFIRDGRKRTGINADVDRIKRMFRWGVSKGLLPSSTYEAIRTLAGLRSGRSEAKEPIPVAPVADEVVDAILPFLSRVVRGMVEFQRTTGAQAR